MSSYQCKMWDVDSVQNHIEPPNHWAVKRAFIISHMSTYPKDRLLALANTFYNMEFLGSRYPSEVEILVSALAKEVPEVLRYREGKRSGLKRTFVSAQDASKAKCQRTNIAIPNKNTKSKQNETINGIKRSDLELVEKVRRQSGVRGSLVLFRNAVVQPYQAVVDSTRKMKIQMTMSRTGARNKNGLLEFLVVIGKEEFCKDYAESEKKARELIGPKILQSLEETCFTVIVKTHLDGQSINKQDTSVDSEKKEALPGDNKGAKIMRLMGWSDGQGLGKHQEGIKKPIEASKNISRMGLCPGGKDLRTLQDNVQKHLEEYAKDTGSHNLVFSNEFSNEERKVIHNIAQKIGMKSKSYGQGESRQLVVSKKLEPWQIVEQLLANNDETINYKLIRPTNITADGVASLDNINLKKLFKYPEKNKKRIKKRKRKQRIVKKLFLNPFSKKIDKKITEENSNENNEIVNAEEKLEDETKQLKIDQEVSTAQNSLTEDDINQLSLLTINSDIKSPLSDHSYYHEDLYTFPADELNINTDAENNVNGETDEKICDKMMCEDDINFSEDIIGVDIQEKVSDKTIFNNNNNLMEPEISETQPISPKETVNEFKKKIINPVLSREYLKITQGVEITDEEITNNINLLNILILGPQSELIFDTEGLIQTEGKKNEIFKTCLIQRCIKEIDIQQEIIRKKLRDEMIEMKKKRVEINRLNKIDREKNRPIINEYDTELLCNVQSKPLNFVLFIYLGRRTTAFDILKQSASETNGKIKLSFKVEPVLPTIADNSPRKHYLVVNGQVVAEGIFGKNQTEAITELSQRFYDKLQKTSFTIEVKEDTSCTEVIHKKDFDKFRDILKFENRNEEKSCYSEAANRMMRLMGWSGGGLGKRGQGIVDPVASWTIAGRYGFGHHRQVTKPTEKRIPDDKLTTKIKELLGDYLKSERDFIVAFQEDFMREEIQKIDRVAKEFGLRTRIADRKTKKGLKVYKVFPKPWQLVQYLMARGDRTDRYTLHRPTDI